MKIETFKKLLENAKRIVERELELEYHDEVLIEYMPIVVCKNEGKVNTIINNNSQIIFDENKIK